MVRNRLPNVDLLRGLVMVVMALDHVRDFTMPSPDPTDMNQSYPALFLTRWITHYCAPVFVFLAGTGAYLNGASGKTRGQLAGFLFTRGLWLIFLELTVFRFFWTLNLNFAFMGGATFWALGWSMIVLSVLIYLPLPVITALGLIMIVGHNDFDGVSVWDAGPLGGVWAVLHINTPVPFGPYVTFSPSYPLIPWIGVMAVGYGFGAILQRERAERRRTVFGLGACLTLAFVLLRARNRYGDPDSWSVQGEWPMTVCSFLNCHKYPPSLLYLLMTLGPALMVLAALDRDPGWFGQRLLVFGRVPLFFYLIHLPVILACAFAAAWQQFGLEMLHFDPTDPPKDMGSLPLVYGLWTGIVLFLYPICAWYAALKQRHRGSVLLSYL